MNEKHVGSCLCGEIRYEVEGSFENFYLCHCQYCQKDTGSAHAANLFSSTAQLKWLTGQNKVVVYRLPSTHHAKSFCSVCGSAVPTPQFNGALLVVPAGSLDSEVTIKANAHLFASSKASWDHNLNQLPCFDGLPT